jgi:hypothetical protein
MYLRLALALGLLLCAIVSAPRAAPVVGTNERVPGSDAEPVDPAEQRPAVIPPLRPAQRGSGPTWVALGPAPTISAQVDVPPNNPVCGAIHRIAAHPSNADIIYIGAVNGGIWKTTNATNANPTWVAQTETLPSQSIGAIAFDPTDGTRNTLLAGTGRWSNFAQRGDDEIGVYRTINGGTTWTHLGASTLLGQKITAVAARGSVLMAASFAGGLFRSIDTGATWTLVSGTGGLPTGGIGDLVGDPSDNARFYISVRGATPRVLRSIDSGASWTDVTTGITGLSASTTNMKLAVGPSGVTYLAVVNSSVLAGVWRSPDQGASWTSMDVPAVHPGGQGTVNTSIVADPNNPNIVYIGGDRITASPFTGNVRRGDASLAAGSQFVPIMDANANSTAPHADSRAMAFDANGDLLQSDDGGIYRQSDPTTNTGTWGSVVGNLNVMEVHDLAHDGLSDIIMIGTQDNSTHIQQTSANPVWVNINSGDGGDVAIDATSLAGAGSFRYLSAQNLSGFRRARYSPTNTFVSNLGMPGGVSDPQFVTPVEINIADATRILVGGASTLYEYTNATTTPVLNTIGAPGANRNAMAAGAAGAPNVAYVGQGITVHRRDGASFVATTALPAGAATVTDVALNPANAAVVFAIDDNQVFRSTDSGGTWQDITGNLPSVSSVDFRTIEFVPQSGGDIVALGTRSGVYYAEATGNTWALLGESLPDVLVFDLRYIVAQNRLIAGTLGRGVWGVTVSGLATDNIFSNGFE